MDYLTFRRILNEEGLKRSYFMILYHGGHGGWQRILSVWPLRKAPSRTLRVPLLAGGLSYDCLCFGKQVYHAKPALDLGDGLNWRGQGPSQFESESVGRYWFL